MKRFVCISLVVLITVTTVFAQSDLQPLVNVKLGKSESITLKQLKARVEVYKKQTNAASFTVEQKKQILNTMIDEKLVLQAAQKAGIAVTDSQVNQYFLQSLSSQIGKNVTEQEFATIVKQQTGLTFDDFMKQQTAMTVAEYKAFLKNQLIAQQYVGTKYQSDIMNSSAPTDTEIRAYYEMYKTQFAQSDLLRLFVVKLDKEDDAVTAKNEISKLLEDVKTNKISLDKIKAQSNTGVVKYIGDYIFIPKNTQAAQQLGMDYNSLLEMFAQDIGYCSEVLETNTDYQFYKIIEKHGAKLLEISDLVQPGTTTTVYEYIKNVLAQQKQAQAFQDATNKVTAELHIDANYQMVKSGDALDKLLDW